MRKLTIIMISGYAGSGKDTLARGLGHPHCAFADYLKEIFCREQRIPMHILFDRRRKEEFRPKLISMASDIKKNDKDVFTRVVVNKIRLFAKYGVDTVVISDWRTVSEYDFLKRTFGDAARIVTVRVERTSEIVHKDTCELDKFHFDLVIENEGAIWDFVSRGKTLVNTILFHDS